jgi:hypothetical protein
MTRRLAVVAAVVVLVLATGALAATWHHARAAPLPCWSGLNPEQTAARRLAYSEGLTILRVLPVQPPGLPPQLLFLTVEDLYPRRSLEERSTPANRFARGGPAQTGTFPRHPLRSHLYLVDPSDPRHPRLLSPEAYYNFWEMSQGDVDGDGVAEIGLCTWSRTALDPHLAYRFFVYGWNAQGDLEPRWRGSRLCRPLIQATLRDLNGDGRAELLSVEKAPDGGQVAVAYAWNQFGFWGLGKSQVYREVCLAGAMPRSGQDSRSFAVDVVGEDDGWRNGWMRLDDGRIVTVEVGQPYAYRSPQARRQGGSQQHHQQTTRADAPR